MKKNRATFCSILVSLTILGAMGCSESTKESAPLPELIQSVQFPYITDNTLYDFNPETGNLKKIDTFENNLILALDTDASKKVTDQSNTLSFSHTTTPEYFVYAKSQKLYIFDLENSTSHLIYNFQNEKIFDPESNKNTKLVNSYICDIQKVVTWDEEARLAKIELFKDERAVFVKTSENEACSDEMTPFSYWKILIVNSDENYTRRRKVLVSHTHKHKHFHDHDDENYEFADLHQHEHTLKAGELDINGEIFDPNNHIHSHSHVHSFIYGDEHEHDYLSKEEVDKVHNNPSNQEIQFETHPILIGKKTSIVSLDEALMYSGKPVIDKINRVFGYLGFNTSEREFKFFKADPESEDFAYTQLWTLLDEDFIFENTHTLSNLQKLSNQQNRIQNFSYADSNIWLSSKNKLIYFTLNEVFDDDQTEAREYRVKNSLFQSDISEPSLKERIDYNPTSKTFLITEGLDIWQVQISNNASSEQSLTKRYNDSTLNSIEAKYFTSTISINKHFFESGENSNAIVLAQNNGLENLTIASKTYDGLDSLILNSNLLINIIEQDTQLRFADYFSDGASSTTRLYESVWGKDAVDYRELKEESVTTLLTSDSSPIAAGSISSPQLFLFDENEPLGQGEEFGYIPEDLNAANKIIFINNMYGMINITNASGEEKDFFFSNLKSSFNFDNEYKVMKELRPVTEE